MLGSGNAVLRPPDRSPDGRLGRHRPRDGPQACSPRGAQLALAARDAANLDEVAALCRTAGAETLILPTDVGVEGDCERAVERTVAAFGGLDTLVLNAGQDMGARLDDLEDSSVLERIMRVNYLGPAWLTRFALPHLKQRRGRIVVVSSLAGLTGVPTRSGYAASKHALHGFFDSLAHRARRQRRLRDPRLP